MPITIPHLVDKQGNPVEGEIRVAVMAAYRSCVRRFSRVDDTLLAGFAESVATSMNSRISEIGTFGSYAHTAMKGKVYEWLRSHPGKEFAVERFEELERMAGPIIDQSFADAEVEVMFSQLQTHLSERERYILILMKQGFGPLKISTALGVTYFAASKAMQRLREHIDALLSSSVRKA